MKKVFHYIEHVWLGDDHKPSVKRALAIAFSIHLMYEVTESIGTYIRLVKAIYIHDKLITPEIVEASGAQLGNLAMIMTIEAGLICGLLGLASYQSIQTSKEDCQKTLIKKKK